MKSVWTILKFWKTNPNLVNDSGTERVVEKKMRHEEMRETLRENVEKFKTIFKLSPYAIGITDLATGKYIDVNDTFVRLCLYSREEVIGHTALELKLWLKADDRAEWFKLLLADGILENSKLSFRKKNGEFFESRVSSSIIEFSGTKYVMSIIQDVTNEKRAMEAVAQNEKKFRALVEHSSEAFALLDANGTVVYESPAAPKISGFSIDERVGQNSLLVIHPHDLELVQRLFNKIIKQPGSSEDAIFRAFKKNGDVYWCEATATNLLHEPTVQGLVVNYRDITSRKLVEEELKRHNAELEESRKQAQESDRLKSMFLNNMSHEIRTPMNAIIGFAELLPFCFDEREKLEEYVQIITRRGNDLLQIIDDILELSKIEAGQLHPHIELVNVDQLLNQVFEFHAQYQNDRLLLELELSVDSKALSMSTDRDMLVKIVNNLISNAFKFTQQGIIKFGCEGVSFGRIHFFVSDTGIGIDSKDQAIIFERFTQLDGGNNRKYEGTGLGLAITKGLLNLLHGTITVESEKGKGSRFLFSIPYITAASAPKILEPIIQADHSILRDKKILLVEDDIFNAQYINEVLRTEGLLVTHVETGTEAVDLIKGGQRYDLILMDIRMPGMNGYTATRLIKEIWPESKIIVQTAHVSSEDRNEAFEAGCDDFLTKPVKQPILLSRIFSLIVR